MDAKANAKAAKEKETKGAKDVKDAKGWTGLPID